MTIEQKVKVLLVDDFKLILEGLNVLLTKQTNFNVIGQASNGRQAIDLAGQLCPDVIIMDVRMPILNGIEATRVISNRYPSIKVIAYSSTQDNATIEEMTEAGACDFLIKGCALGKIIKSIEDAVDKMPTTKLDVCSPSMKSISIH